jgi:hypothetical protein
MSNRIARLDFHYRRRMTSPETLLNDFYWAWGNEEKFQSAYRSRCAISTDEMSSCAVNGDKRIRRSMHHTSLLCNYFRIQVLFPDQRAVKPTLPN